MAVIKDTNGVVVPDDVLAMWEAHRRAAKTLKLKAAPGIDYLVNGVAYEMPPVQVK